MSKSKVSVFVRCPYYKREERKNGTKIVCEGPGEGIFLHLMFDSLDRLKENRKCYCMANYNKCPIAQMLNRKYHYDT